MMAIDSVIFKKIIHPVCGAVRCCVDMVRVSIRCTNHHTCPCMVFVCYDTRTHTLGANWVTYVFMRARACVCVCVCVLCVVCRLGYIAIVVVIKYIVLEGVVYNGFLLFIKTEASLQSIAVCFLTTRVYLELCRFIFSAMILLTNRMHAIRWN